MGTACLNSSGLGSEDGWREPQDDSGQRPQALPSLPSSGEGRHLAGQLLSPSFWTRALCLLASRRALSCVPRVPEPLLLPGPSQGSARRRVSGSLCLQPVCRLHRSRSLSRPLLPITTCSGCSRGPAAGEPSWVQSSQDWRVGRGWSDLLGRCPRSWATGRLGRFLLPGPWAPWGALDEKVVYQKGEQ